jgi:hypothetical protein
VPEHPTKTNAITTNTVTARMALLALPLMRVSAARTTGARCALPRRPAAPSGSLTDSVAVAVTVATAGRYARSDPRRCRSRYLAEDTRLPHLLSFLLGSGQQYFLGLLRGPTRKYARHPSS